MPVPQVHCNIDEKTVSLVIFLTRLLSGLVLLYVCAGCLLFYKDFLTTAAVLRVPAMLAIGSVVVELFLALLLLLGWFTRWAAGLSVLCMGLVGFVFFASNFNKVYRCNE